MTKLFNSLHLVTLSTIIATIAIIVIYPAALPISPASASSSLYPVSEQIIPGKSELGIPEVEEIIFSADRIPMSHEISTACISVVPYLDMESSPRKNLTELLSNIPSLDSVQSSALSGPGSIFLRGANAGHTTILLNGIRLRDPIAPNGALDTTLLTTTGLDRVEVVRGPMSSSWGSDAMGGVIGLHTIQGEGDPTGELSLLYGSEDTFQKSLAFSGSEKKLSFSVAADILTSSGISMAGAIHGNTERDASNSEVLTVDFNQKMTREANLGLFLRTQRRKNHIDDSGGLNGDDPDRRTGSMLNTGALKLEVKNSSAIHRFILSRSKSRRTDHDATNPDEFMGYLASTFSGTSEDAEWQMMKNLPRGTIQTGLAWSRDTGESRLESMTQFGPFTSIFSRMAMENRSAFLSTAWKINSTMDRNGNCSSIFGMALRNDSRKNGDSKTTYRISLGHQLTDRFKLRMNFGTGFKSPTLYQLHAPDYGDRNLRSETSRGWDISLESTTDETGKISLTWFANTIEQLIDFNMVTWKYLNLSKAHTQGVEAQWFLPDKPWGQFSLFLSTLKAINEETGERLPRRARLRGGITFRKEWRKLAFTAKLTHQSGAQDLAGWPAALISMDRSTIMDIDLIYRLKQYVTVQASVRDLGNQSAEPVTGYGSEGRTFHAGVRFCF